MTYTNAWNESSPLGSAPRSTVDDIVRGLKLDLRERLNEIFVDWTADPVVLKPAYNGAVTGKHKYIHYSKFYAGDTDTIETEAYISDAGGGRTMFCAIELPPGVIITQVKVLVDPTGNLISQRLKRITFDLSASEVDIYSSVSSSGTGLTILDSGALTHTVLDGNMYMLRVGMNSNSRLYGAEITYNVPDAQKQG